MSPGEKFRETIAHQVVPLIGVHDVFSATLAARQFDGLFLSGFGFAASHYGLPDLGFIAWSDMASYVERVRAVLPDHHILVDIDDGYGDPEVAAEVVRRLERAGASAVILEDQLRPRRCGHYDGKQIMELPQYLEKLHRVLKARTHLCVLARTDTQQPEEVQRRACAFAEAGADAVMAEAVRDLETFVLLRKKVGAPLVCNQIAGGKTPSWSLTQMASAGVRIVIYSTPTLFATQRAITDELARLKREDGRLPSDTLRTVQLSECTAALQENLARGPKRNQP